MFFAVGLGNSGRRYDGTRHNTGFAVVDVLAARAGAPCRRAWRLKSAWAEGVVEGERVALIKPLTMMNRSGEALAAWQRRKGLMTDRLLLIYDDVALPCGRIRVRAGGGAGGHNGVRSVMESLGSQEFSRVRVGVGEPTGGQDRVGFVLSRFKPGERETIGEAVQRAADAAEHIVKHGVESAMNAFNGQDG